MVLLKINKSGAGVSPAPLVDLILVDLILVDLILVDLILVDLILVIDACGGRGNILR